MSPGVPEQATQFHPRKFFRSLNGFTQIPVNIWISSKNAVSLSKRFIIKRKEALDRVISELKLYAPEAQIILYGSEARGDARPDSDIDLLVLLPDLKDEKQYVMRRSDISGRLFELSLDLDVDISPIILPKSVWMSRKTQFTVNVMNEGVRI